MAAAICNKTPIAMSASPMYTKMNVRQSNAPTAIRNQLSILIAPSVRQAGSAQVQSMGWFTSIRADQMTTVCFFVLGPFCAGNAWSLFATRLCTFAFQPVRPPRHLPQAMAQKTLDLR